MSDRVPDFVDPLRLAEQGRRIEGRIKLERLSRLGSLLSSQKGEVIIDVEFGVGADGIPALRGTLSAQLEMYCQRCMTPAQFAIEAGINLGIVKNEQEAALLPDEYEPLQVEHEPTHFGDIVEDELILALPIAPMHEKSECAAWEPAEEPAGDEEEKKNPFSVLAELKSASDEESN